jgi:hypothetical protein
LADNDNILTVIQDGKILKHKPIYWKIALEIKK